MSGSVPILYGASCSVYVRAAVMALETKSLAYDHKSIDIFAEGGPGHDYLHLNPFGKIPALTHGDFTLFETIAINRYVDEAFDGPPLQPASPRDRARMMQLVSMADSYGYRPLVWGIYVESTLRPTEGKIPDQQLITAAIPKARRYLETLDGLSSQQRYLTCDHPTLADFHTAPIFGYFLESEIGRQMIGAFPRLQQWWGNISSLPAWKTALKP